MNNEQKITTNIKVPNKDLETLKTHFPHYFDKNGNFDFEKFKNYLTEKEVSFSTESYGLEWLGKSYARLLASEPATTLLKADPTHNRKRENSNAENLLIKGDNLEVLKHLANAYYEKVKMIYIDPPYNTGNDGFMYKDDRKYTVKELQHLIGIDEEKAKRILAFTQSKSNSHSAWLTFMYPRLYIARQLLREDGVIFVSIDDNEVAQLRLLMDEIFGEENFVANIIWKKKQGGGNDSSHFVIEHEYILVYSKFVSYIEINSNPDLVETNNYPFEDENGKYNLVTLDKSSIQFSKSLVYEIIDNQGNVYLPRIIDGKQSCWRWSKERVEKEFDSLVFKDGKVYTKFYMPDGYKNKTLWVDAVFGRTSHGKKQIKDLFQAEFFSYPKPLELLKNILKSSTKNSDIILDFFAGSGTTGHAVMQLNAEDGGNRKFILVQLPEAIDPKKNKTAYDFVKNELKAEPTIFEITKERLLRAAKKIKEETIHKKIAEKEKQIKDLESQLDLENKEEQIAQLKKEIQTLQNQDLGFKIFETMPIWEDYHFEAEEFDNSLNLFDESNLTEEDIKALLTTWKTYDGIPLTQELQSVNLSGYTAYYGNGKLYLMHKGFTTDALKALLEKIDTDKHFEPKSIIAFGYHFESARLRELAENLKNYNNKKKSDIDFIIRY